MTSRINLPVAYWLVWTAAATVAFFRDGIEGFAGFMILAGLVWFFVGRHLSGSGR